MTHTTKKSATRLATIAAILPTLWVTTALADPLPPARTDSSATPTSPAAPQEDPTGGAYTTPTLLFIPAAAVPVWNVRVIASLDMQGPTASDYLASGTSIGFLPG